MGALEIFVLIAGGIIFVLSFILPQSKEVPEETKELAKEEIKALVSQEMDGVRNHVDDVVEEAVSYAVEKTERSLERLTNEKIMAVNEYSDTVLQDIHKNHEEVVFLYDMLNSKQVNLKNTVSEINKTVKEAEEAKKEAEAVVNTFQKLQVEEAAVNSFQKLQAEETAVNSFQKLQAEEATVNSFQKLQVEEEKTSSATVLEMPDGMDISFMQDEEGMKRNSNEKILELYRQGKSNVSIAKELGLGVGEVKLVIDLYKNM